MKAEKKATGVSQRHLYSRISFLYQAATHLMSAGVDRELGITTADGLEPVHSDSNHHSKLPDEEAQKIDAVEPETLPTPSYNSNAPVLLDGLGPSCQLISHLRSVSLKGQIRLSPALKHSICKRCDALLVPGGTSSVRVENKSRDGKKPWADVLVVTCLVCNATKRFPVGAKRQCRKGQRGNETKLVNNGTKLI